MKKSAFIITSLLIATQSFATGITGNSATCDTGALGSEDGSVAMRANYEPESIGLQWYDENNQLLTVNSASQSCTYGGSITIPNPPTKTGYKFTGWKIINIFSTLPIGTDGEHRYSKDESNSNDVCWYDGNTVTCDSSFDDLSRHQWKTIFDYGTIYGDAMCSTTSGSWVATGTPTNDGGQNCWCMATGYKPNGSDVVYSPNPPLSWVYGRKAGSSGCAYSCADDCARYSQVERSFRVRAFGLSN